MLRFKFLAVSILILALYGCGFTPLHHQHANSQPPVNIKVALIANREGQILRNYLLDRLNPYNQAQIPDYILNATYTIDKTEFGFRRDATPKRTDIRITVPFSLVKPDLKTVVYQDRVDISMGFSMGAQSATASLPQVMSEEDAVKRIMEQAALEIQMLITSYLHVHKD